MFTDTITVLIDPLHDGGYLVESDDLPELNIFVSDEANLATAIPAAIKYLYRHNKKVDVQVRMQGYSVDIPRTESNSGTQRCVELRSAA